MGKCLQCGACCATPSIMVNMDEDTAFFYSNFGIEIAMIDNEHKGKFLVGTICKHRTQQENGKYRCDIYEDRPEICKNYPGNQPKHSGCGYN